MTAALGERIDYDGTEDAFLSDLGDVFCEYMGRADAADYFVAYCQFELRRVQRLGADLLGGEPDITPEKLGFTPTSFHDWIVQNRDTFTSGR